MNLIQGDPKLELYLLSLIMLTQIPPDRCNLPTLCTLAVELSPAWVPYPIGA